ncbi:hypothetical protein KAU39_00885 [bacterium]|nr:hypothetical protein [bacterium]
MPRNLKIMKEGEWFLGKDEKQEYPVCYRYVICYSLRSFLCSVDFDKDLGLMALKELKDNIGKKSHFKKDYFLEIFPLKEDLGFVVVDQSNGIYPLVIYAEGIGDCNQKVTAFKMSIDEVIRSYDKIFDIFSEGKSADWTKGYQENLFEKAGFIS